MKIILKINEENNISLSLLDGKKEKDGLEWKDNSNLSRLLLSKIDQLLKNNKIGLDKISGYKIMSQVPENYTSFRIAKMTLESLIIGKEFETRPK